MTDFFDSNQIIYKYQFGFRKEHSTQQAIISLVEKITSSLDSRDIVIGIFLDLKKAFDTVDHRIMIRKLYASGIRGNILNWFISYLDDRSQYVAFDETHSSTQSIKSGIPRGSILGPLLLIIYINDICNVSEMLFYILYADDTTVIIKDKDISILLQTLNVELEKLSIWLKANKLSLNAKKTYYLVFHRARIKINITADVIMNDTLLNRANQVKYLGIIIDHKLNWVQHTTYIKNKIAKGIGIMYKARRFLSKVCQTNLYHTYIYPYLIYCIEVWGIAPKCHLNHILLIQKKIVRIIRYTHYLAHTEIIFKELGILPIEKIFIERVGVFMFKYENGLLPPVMAELYLRNNEIHNYETRNCNKFSIAAGTETFSHVSARIWNALTSKINVNTSISKFKILLKSFLRDNTLPLKYTK